MLNMLPSFFSAGASGLEAGWTPLGKDGCVWMEAPMLGRTLVHAPCGGPSPPSLPLEKNLFQMALISHSSGP